MRLRKEMIGCLALAGLSASLGACSTAEGTSEKVVGPRPAKMYVVGSGAGDARSFPGTLKASNTVDLAFRVGGPLVAVPAKEGQTVKKGALLARVDPRDFRVRVSAAEAQLAAARAQLQNAQTSWDRISKLAGHDAIPQARVDEARSGLDVAKAQLESAAQQLEAARLALKDTELRAPFEARVAAVLIDNHQNIGAGKNAIRLQSTGALEVDIDVPEASLAALVDAEGGALEVSFPGHPGVTIPASLAEYETDIDAEVSTYRVTLGISSDDAAELGNVYPGMTATVHWKGSKSQTLIVPLAAVSTRADGGAVVYRVGSDMRLEAVSVKTGALFAHGVEIAEGLSIGDEILAAGVRAAYEGLEVRRAELGKES